MNWTDLPGDWWLTCWPEGYTSKGARKRIKCDRCGTEVDESKLAAHQRGMRCRDSVMERRLHEDGWLPVGTIGGVFMSAGIAPLSVGGQWWAPNWAAIIVHSMQQWQGNRGKVVPRLLQIAKKDESIRAMIVALAYERRNRMLVPPVYLLSLLPTLDVTANVLNLERGFGLRTFHQWLKALARADSIEQSTRIDAAERAFAVINEVLAIEPSFAGNCTDLRAAAERTLNKIRRTDECYCPLPPQRKRLSSSPAG